MTTTAEKGHLLPPLFREAYPRHTVKAVERIADVSHETARNWVRGRASPSADTLLSLAARCDALADALQRMLDARRAARMDDRCPAEPRRVAPLAAAPHLTGG